MPAKFIDLRSDTASQPTDEMRTAMANAIVGDDFLGEDPTVERLETMSAAMFGKEAGLFVISGTMANQIAIMALTQPGDEVIVGSEAHIYNLEAGGLAALSSVQARPLRAEQGRFSAEDVREAIRPKGLQSSITRVLCLENTYDLNRGIPLPRAYMQEMADIARQHDAAVYLDGARIFNAAIACDTPLDVLCQPIDCMQFCLSKGLAAPVGSVLTGTREFIARARWMRQRIGGGMRQAGHMAAAGIVALEKMLPRLRDDHKNARHLAEGLASLDARIVDPAAVLTNIVRADFSAAGRTAAEIAAACAAHNIKVKPIGTSTVRMITHWGIEREDIDAALNVYRAIV
jgi:threonine aldolase